MWQEKPLKEKDQDIYCLLLVGLFQLSDMRVPAHAAVAETVAAADVLKKSWAKNLINAVLRNYQRKEEELKLKLSKEAYYDHPALPASKTQKRSCSEAQGRSACRACRFAVRHGVDK